MIDLAVAKKETAELIYQWIEARCSFNAVTKTIQFLFQRQPSASRLANASLVQAFLVQAARRMKLNRKPIYLLAAQLTKLKDRAKALGVFTNERELLACPKCGLVEDVTCDGLLITCLSSALEQDSGLRFEATSNNQFRCPACGSIAREESTRARLPNKTKLRRTASGRSKFRQ